MCIITRYNVHFLGTNLDVRKRLALFFMYLCTIMVAQAIFYGREQSNIVQDIFASFFTSLIGTLPQMVIKHLFAASRSRQKYSIKQLSNEYSAQIRSRASSKGEMGRFEKISDLRDKLYRDKFYLPPCYRECAWGWLIVISLAACFIAVCPCNISAIHSGSMHVFRCFDSW